CRWWGHGLPCPSGRPVGPGVALTGTRRTTDAAGRTTPWWLAGVSSSPTGRWRRPP
ncbi:MAG: hypothetical protein AVDCRST_MAG49-3437, partial [uncultured Thermomicrobiales bacterium]